MTAICGCGRDFPKAFGLRVHQRTCTHQTAPDGAGAAPTGEATRTSDPLVETGGASRTTAAGPSNPPAEPGRPTCEHGYRYENALCPVTTCGASAHVEAPPATSILSGLSIAEITAARLAADPASAEVPFEAGGALHVVERCGCNDCEDAFGEIGRAHEAANAENVGRSMVHPDRIDFWASSGSISEIERIKREYRARYEAATAACVCRPFSHQFGDIGCWGRAQAGARAELLANSTPVGGDR